VVYLSADTKVLMERIAMRDRPYERNMEEVYIDTLNKAYDDFFDNYFQGVPVLRVDTNKLNIVSNSDDRDLIEKQIRARLAEIPRQTEMQLGAEEN
jgi:deoxyguanosine kinase